MGNLEQIRLKLNVDHFKKLIKGGVVEVDVGSTTVQIILSDIGYQYMIEIISDEIGK